MEAGDEMNLNMMQCRAISGLPSTVLLALWSSATPLPIKELVYWCDTSDDDALRRACGLLERLGYVEVDVRERGEKFYRLASNAQLLPGFSQVLPAPTLPAPGKPGAGRPVVIEVATVDGLKDLEASSFDGQNAPESGKPGAGTGSINLINDDDLINLNTDSSSLIMNPFNFSQQVIEVTETTVFNEPAKFPTLEKLLESMDMLFGDHLDAEMFAPGLSPQLALAWICKAYFDAQKNPGFRNPIGLIRKRLQAMHPRKIARLNEMPEKFLEEIGLWEGKCSFCAQGFRSRASLNAHLLEGHKDDAKDDDDNGAGSQAEGDLSIFPGWADVLLALREEMPSGLYDTWVRDTLPLSWQDKDSKLVVGARNEYACRWLANRAAANAERILKQITGRDVTIEFE